MVSTTATIVRVVTLYCATLISSEKMFQKYIICIYYKFLLFIFHNSHIYIYNIYINKKKKTGPRGARWQQQRKEDEETKKIYIYTRTSNKKKKKVTAFFAGNLGEMAGGYEY